MDENQMPKLILIWRSSSILEEYMVGIYHNVEITIGHFPTNFNIWPTKIHFGLPNLLYIFNGMAIDNLQKCPIFKKWPTNF